jgi:hypothetical protein
MKTISLVPDEQAVVNICKMFLGNVLENVQEKRDEDGVVYWGKADAYALLVGALDAFKSLNVSSQNELVEYFERFTK